MEQAEFDDALVDSTTESHALLSRDEAAPCAISDAEYAMADTMTMAIANNSAVPATAGHAEHVGLGLEGVRMDGKYQG